MPYPPLIKLGRKTQTPGCSLVWLKRVLWEHETASSSLAIPTYLGLEPRGLIYGCHLRVYARMV